jgi:hypothetical protein
MDTSGSMSGVNGNLRDDHWDSVHPMFADMEMRYVAFSGRSDQEVQVNWEEKTEGELSSLRPRVFNSNTYLWGLIIEEANAMIAQGMDPQEILIYLVTDGMDNASSGPLYGFSGISNCIDQLNQQGFHAEFWIVGVGLSPQSASSYLNFANRSGGRYFDLQNQNDLPEITQSVRAFVEHKTLDAAGWRRERIKIIRDFASKNPHASTLVLDGTRALPLLRSIIPLGHVYLIEKGTKADAAMESREIVAGRKNKRRHFWIYLTAETYSDMTEAQISSLAREFYTEGINGKVHLILDGFGGIPRAGATAGLGAGALPDLRRWVVHDDLRPLVQQIADGFTRGLDSDKVEIGTVAEMREAKIIPIPDQPYVVLDGDHGSRVIPWWDGRNSMDGWNAVPGLPGAPCFPGLIVTPYVNCHQVHATYREYGYEPREHCGFEHPALWEFDECTSNHRGWNVPNPNTRLPDPFSETTHEAVWMPHRECFVEILKEAICHLLRCPAERVVVDLTQLGAIIGLDQHPALRCFEEAVKSIDPSTAIHYRFSRVNGLL